ncbi:MAG: DUF2240 family protein [Promethearchaeota archaeon]
MQNRDVLWAVSIPFRMYNTKELDINTFTFTLSFDTALMNCNISTARKLITFALEKGWLEISGDNHILHAKFELWEPKSFPSSWNPIFSNIEDIPMIDLIPLDSSTEYKPQRPKIVKKPEVVEVEPLFTREHTEKAKEKEVIEQKEIKKEKEPAEKKEIAQKKERKPSKKKKSVKKAKTRGQKSISDFFR